MFTFIAKPGSPTAQALTLLGAWQEQGTPAMLER